MSESPVVEIDVQKTLRVNRLVDEYGPADTEEFLQAMEKITKKLGGQHFKAAKEKLLQGDMASTIDILLAYYDKAYRSGLEKKKHRIKLHTKWNGINVNDYAGQLVDEVNALPILV